MEKSIPKRRGERRLPPSPNVAPWLVFPHGKDGKYHSFYNICNGADEKLKKRSLNKFLPELSTKSFRQKNCHQGWLIVLCNDDIDPNYGDCFLWNPQTLDKIQLPSILHYYETEDKYRLKDCILTSPPRLNTSNSNSSNSSDGDNYDRDSVVYFLFDGGHNKGDFTDVLLFCHPGEKEWRRYQLNVSEKPKKMLYLKNKLHVMCSNYVYFEIQVQGASDMDGVETLAVGDEISISVEGIAESEPQPAGGGMVRTREEYFVESFGEVYIIEKWSIPRGIYSNCVPVIQIWKLDFASVSWKNVKSLDDHAFFISYHTQLSCLASDLGFSKGCMYYTQDEEMSLYKYDLEDRSILLSFPCPHLPTPWFQPEWLMIAPPPRVDDKSIQVIENRASVSWDIEKDDIEQ
ncbi:hypothetical protein MKW92_035894, partial [Papaver armeniacum]